MTIDASGRPVSVAFDLPPVTETVMGIEFAPLPSLGFVQIARLADLWSSDYPKIEEKPALEPGAQGMGLTINFQEQPSVRLWVQDDDRGFLLQAQKDRLVLNWRKLPGIVYPRYSAIKTEFMKRWSELENHLASNNLDTAVPLKVEFTYVNQVILDDGEVPHDAISLLGSPSSELPGQASFARFQFVRELTGLNNSYPGQLIVTGEPQRDENGESYVVSLAGHLSLPAGAAQRDIETAFDLAHGYGAQAFAAITTDRMHERWGRSA